MNRQEFITQLGERLSGLPKDDVAERLAFYGEMIDDRMEDGASEEEAVAELGPIDDIVSQMISETPLPKIVKEKIKPKRRLHAWEIILIIVGFPVWLPLLITAVAVLFTIYVVIWTVIVTLWAIDVSFIVSSLGSIAIGVFECYKGFIPQGLLMFGAALCFAGLAIFLFIGCVAITKGACILTKKIALGVKKMFLRKEGAQ